MGQVDVLLAEQEAAEVKKAREQATAVKQYAAHKKNTKKESILQEAKVAEETEPRASEIRDGETLSSILGDPRSVEAMMRWSERLAAVPYVEWTVGASTALDHWIARQVLGLQEETWLALLEGSRTDLIDQGRNIVATRETLFPETRIASPTETEERAMWQHTEIPSTQDTDEDEQVEKSVEELLASLGSLSSDSPTTAVDETPSLNLDDESIDTQVNRLMDQLQEWRRRHAEAPFEEWGRDEQDAMNKWIQQ